MDFANAVATLGGIGNTVVEARGDRNAIGLEALRPELAAGPAKVGDLSPKTENHLLVILKELRKALQDLTKVAFTENH